MQNPIADTDTVNVRDSAKMTYDIKEFYSDMHDRSEWVSGQEKLDWLIMEVARLQDEVERLLEENRTLREEVTLARLGGVEMAPATQPDPTHVLPEAARVFYHTLPATFVFSEFFHHALEEGVDSAIAKDYLRLFLREKLLLQKGQRIEKVVRS